MATGEKIGTGLTGLDNIIDMLRPGDNVVWRVQSPQEYKKVVDPFVKQARSDARKIIYVRFGKHAPLLDEGAAGVTCTLAAAGFESFTSSVYDLLTAQGPDAFYVFDCLTDLLEFWYSDLLIGNFFRIICPYLFRLETVAYFAVLRGSHTYATIAGIRDTTQLLLDIYSQGEDTYIHPLKAAGRHSPTMFFPHLVSGDNAVSVTSSAQAAQLLTQVKISPEPRDYWEVTLAKAEAALAGSRREQEEAKELLISLIGGYGAGVHNLCRKYLSLEDILGAAKREIGSGSIGGKSVGMLLARKILKSEMGEALQGHWEKHDSFYLGTDVFYSYIVQNGWWPLRMRQKTPEGYFSAAPELRDKIARGVFPAGIREKFMRMLEYFGQAPIIVRSSSLLEDNYGNAFAGKYQTVFCANQGTPEERRAAFEQAVRTVYASAVSEEALTYRMNRGLMDRDEQMAVLVQRVSGDHYGDRFFPHISGVGNSTNLYVWGKGGDPEAGMLRLVLGLGTRAVSRAYGDHARLVALDQPARLPPINSGDEKKFSQHRMDLLDLKEGMFTDTSVANIAEIDLRADKSLFFSPDPALAERLDVNAQATPGPSSILDFRAFLEGTEFPAFARKVLRTLAKAYDYPVDIEFTVNFLPGGNWIFNLLQCRPLQTRGFGAPKIMPEPEPESILIRTSGGFMGGNVKLPLDYVVFVRAEEYLGLRQQEQYAVARLIGEVNKRLKDKKALLAGPGRWGTSTPLFGVPVHFTELCNMAVICEYEFPEAGVSPDLSFGSHFFQNLVESGIFYSAVFARDPELIFQPHLMLKKENQLGELIGMRHPLERAVHIASTDGLTLCSDVDTQRLVCFMA